MMWLSEYQSLICWLFSADHTAPVHNLIVPHGQIGGRCQLNSIPA